MNSNSIEASRINGGNGSKKRAAHDFYPTPPEVTIALMDFLRLPKFAHVWEPASGEGDMAQALVSLGYCVEISDIMMGDQFDFLKMEMPEYTHWIITNPPFSQSEQFIRRAAEFGIPFAFLLKAQYWHAEKRRKLYEEITPSYILPLTWRPDFLFKQQSGGAPLMDMAWNVWDLRSRGAAQYIPIGRPKEEDHAGG